MDAPARSSLTVTQQLRPEEVDVEVARSLKVIETLFGRVSTSRAVLDALAQSSRSAG
jgi:hypothetical protein